MQNENGQTEISQACLDNDLLKVKSLIATNPACILEKNWNNSTAIHVAVKFARDINIVKAILGRIMCPCSLRASNQYHQDVYDYVKNRGEHLKDESQAPELLKTKAEVIELLKAKSTSLGISKD